MRKVESSTGENVAFIHSSWILI